MKKPKPLTHAEFSSRGGKAGTPAQNAARAANSLKSAQIKLSKKWGKVYGGETIKPIKQKDAK